jgi:hypothetical protein
MKQKLRNILLLLALGGVMAVQAGNPQRSLRIAKASEADLFGLDSIQEITFTNGNMVLTSNDSPSVSFVLSDITEITFVASNTSVVVNQEEIKPNFSLTNDVLTVLLGERAKDVFTVSLFNSTGAVFNVKPQISTDGISIPVAVLPKGFYICSLKSEKKIYNIKFVKK